jgi:hypothetical protein
MTQSKERIILMETKSPASTSGALLLTDAEVKSTEVILLPAHVNLTGYTPPEEDPQFEMIQLDWDVKAQRLTHPSATAGYATFRSDCIGMGIPPISFAAWLSAANLAVKKELMKEHHLTPRAMTAS